SKGMADEKRRLTFRLAGVHRETIIQSYCGSRPPTARTGRRDNSLKIVTTPGQSRDHSDNLVGIDEAMLDRRQRQFNIVADPQLLIDPVLVGVDGFGADVENCRHLPRPM